MLALEGATGFADRTESTSIFLTIVSLTLSFSPTRTTGI